MKEFSESVSMITYFIGMETIVLPVVVDTKLVDMTTFKPNSFPINRYPFYNIHRTAGNSNGVP